VLNVLGCACNQGLLHLLHTFSLKPICIRKAEPSGRQLTAFPVQSLHISQGDLVALQTSERHNSDVYQMPQGQTLHKNCTIPRTDGEELVLCNIY